MLNEGLETLGGRESRESGVFQGSELCEIRLPATLRVIGVRAFLACSNLKTVWLPEGLRVIEKSAFLRSGLQSVSFPASLEEIYDGAFCGTGLEMAALGGCSRLRIVGKYAFGEIDTLDRRRVRFPRCAKVSEKVFSSPPYMTGEESEDDTE